jgi:hypothetical protein
MRLCGGVEVEFHISLISAPDGSCQHLFPPTPGKMLWYVSGRRLGESEGLSGCGEKDKSLFSARTCRRCTATIYVDTQRRRWSRGSVLAFGTQIRGFAPGRSRRIFRAKKFLSTPFFGGGSKAVGPMS